MRLSRFFITRPIFAAVIAIFITIVGGIAYLGLPVSQYPDIVPPTVTVTASYPGATAQTVAETVAAPTEQKDKTGRAACLERGGRDGEIEAVAARVIKKKRIKQQE